MDDFYYRKLKVYHLAKQLAGDIYRLSGQFPAKEQHILGYQIQRAAISVPSNIAEGMGRFSVRERIHFLEIANGSLMETMCQLEIAEAQNYIRHDELVQQENKIREISKMLIGLRCSLEAKLSK